MFKTTVAAEPTVCQDRVTFDHAGRATQTIENYKTGASTNADEDVITDFTYTADGQISTMTARNSLTGDQTTRYVYGTDLAATPVVYRNDLLRAEIYPDSDDTTNLGNGADGVFDRVEYMQNRQGEVIQKKDQNGTVHTYDYDLLGRLEHDRVLTVGVGVDNAVRRISISYTRLGLPFQITSYSSATVGAGTVLNQIERTYFGFGQLANEYQALTGAKDGTTPWVAYGYDSTARGLRPLSVRYPNGRQAYTTYGATGSVADKINRIDAVTDDNGGVPGSVLAQYTYLGRGTIVLVNSPTPTLTLDLIGSGTAYAGFDRFLRVVDQRWKGPGGADLDRYQHGYDQASNRIFRDNLTTSLKDEYYTYDGLQRLKNFDRGDLNAGRTGIAGTPVREEDWTLDRTGNWPGYVVKASGATSLNQTRGHNPANEITSLAATVGTVWAAAAHDRNGNMTSLPKPASLGTALTCKYDAWNRLVEIKEGTTVLGAYKYDGLMRRIEKVAGGSTTRYYHSNQWQVLEERVDSTTLPRAQYVWGPRYVDDLIVRDRDSSAPFDGVLNERLYYLQDANWNVTALVSTSGVVQERYAYEPYGGPLVFNGSWGSISASAFANAFTYTGRQLDSESGIYQYRYRYYHAQLGRFVGRDLAPRILFNLFDYCVGRPLSAVDPMGLECDLRSEVNYLVLHLAQSIALRVGGQRLANAVARQVALSVVDGPLPIGDIIGAIWSIWDAVATFREIASFQELAKEAFEVIGKLVRNEGQRFTDCLNSRSECCQIVLDLLGHAATTLASGIAANKRPSSIVTAIAKTARSKIDDLAKCCLPKVPCKQRKHRSMKSGGDYDKHTSPRSGGTEGKDENMLW